MSTPLRTLIIEDSENDTLLIIDELREGGYEPVYQRVETREQMKAALDQQEWDMIIADYRLPDFNGLEALEIACENPDSCPFIIVSGQISEETAVNAMRAGAKDYILKENLKRLLPAVERELREAEVRRQRRKAEEDLRKNRELLHTVVDTVPAAIYLKDLEGRLLLINREFENIMGIPRAQILGKTDYNFLPEETADIITANDQSVLRSGRLMQVEEILPLADGEHIYLSVKVPARDPDGRIYGLCGVSTDITHQKELERQTAQQASTLAAIMDTVPVGIVVADAGTRNITYFSKYTEVILGEAVTGNAGEPASHSYQLLKADGTPFTPEELPLPRSLSGEAASNVEIRVRRRDGTEVTAISNSAPIVDADGHISAAVATLSDINEIIALRTNLEQALERERHFSLQLQRALLPEEPSINHGYDVAVEYIPYYMGREIGGDFYDVFEVTGGKAGVVIGDVSGKGLEAASLAAATRSTIHALVHETASAGEALARANSILCKKQHTFETQFVTVFVTVIDLETGEINYASAGHPPAAIRRADGNVRFLKPDFQPPVCLMPETAYPESCDQLAPGDMIVMYTDGVAEARRNKVMFDLKGIAQVLGEHGHLEVDDVAGNLTAAACNWAEGQLSDDAAVVVVKRLQTYAP